MNKRKKGVMKINFMVAMQCMYLLDIKQKKICEIVDFSWCYLMVFTNGFSLIFSALTKTNSKKKTWMKLQILLLLLMMKMLKMVGLPVSLNIDFQFGNPDLHSTLSFSKQFSNRQMFLQSWWVGFRIIWVWVWLWPLNSGSRFNGFATFQTFSDQV